MKRVRHYPKPGPVGGQLIRQVIAFLRQSGVSLPLMGRSVIAVSGGADSKALVLLLARYGRRILKDAPLVAHADHGWREQSSQELREVATFAKRLGLDCETTVLPSSNQLNGRSLEEHARNLRYSWLEDVRKSTGAAWILTAHHQGDLAETVLWALCTGQADRRGGGIRVCDPPLLRPFLGVSKDRLQAFLREEGEAWFEDSSNCDLRFLRARLREQVLPGLQSVFPNAVEHLAALGLTAQSSLQERAEDDAAPLSTLLGDRGLRLRSSQWRAVSRSPEKGADLPNGWRIRKEMTCHSDGEAQVGSQVRWVLEKKHSLNE